MCMETIAFAAAKSTPCLTYFCEYILINFTYLDVNVISACFWNILVDFNIFSWYTYISSFVNIQVFLISLL